MATKLSRRAIADHVTNELLKGGSHTELVQQLAAYLIESRRTKELGLIIRDVQYRLSEKGVISGVVTSAFDLSTATTKAIEQYVAGQTGATRVSLDTQVDPTVLGGVKISLPGRELDHTVRRNLTILKTRYKKA